MCSVSRLHDWLKNTVLPQPDKDDTPSAGALWSWVDSDSEEVDTFSRWKNVVRPPPIQTQNLDMFRPVVSRPGTPKP